MLTGDNEYVHETAAAWVTVTVCEPTVMWPTRELAVVFAATVYVVLPLPVPLVGVTVSQLLSLVAAHPQLLVVETEMVPLPPALTTETVVGESVYEQDEAAASMTEKLWLPKVRVPVLEAIVVFAAAVYVTVPLPTPFAGDAVSHVALLVAAQAHPPVVVTVNVPVPPAALIDARLGVKVKVQDEVPACTTATVWPPIVIVPVRELGVVFAAAVYVTVPVPVPPPGDTVSQLLSLVVVHAQEDCVVTVMVPVPPVDVTAIETGESV
jgi:hypothetical protein